MKKYGSKGSVSLEACIVVPVFIMLMMLVYGLFVMFMGQQVVTHAVTQSAKSLAYDPYAIERGAANSEAKLTKFFGEILRKDGYVSNAKWYSTDSKKLNSVVTSRVRSYLTQDGEKETSTVNNKLKTFGVRNGVNGLRFSDSKVENGVLTLKVAYTQDFPMDAFGLVGFDRVVTVKVRLFTWKELPNSIYEISFNSNGGSAITKKVTNESNDKLPVPTRKNYAFLGWSTDPNATTPNVPDLNTAKKLGEENGDSTLYAVWLSTVKVTWFVPRTPNNANEVYRYDKTLDNSSYTDTVYVGVSRQLITDLGLKTVKVTISVDAKRIEDWTGGSNEEEKVKITSGGNTVYNKHISGIKESWKTITINFEFPVSQLATNGEISIKWIANDPDDWNGDTNDGWKLGTTSVTVYLE